jgi:hypothetical protein
MAANELSGSEMVRAIETHTPRSHPRTKEEVFELKAMRRGEIERRALLLDPPLEANVLAHMPSFQAAIQIITPLDDSAWELLLPRLLAQRADAEQRERDSVTNAMALQESLNDQGQLDASASDSKEVLDKDWDEVQGPVRARISGFADKIIRDGWEKGRTVNKESSARFAAEVLVYVRKRFYEEVAKDISVAQAAGLEPQVDPPGGPFTQKLTLENMKWVFDTKIKPHTETFRKELFLCHGCQGFHKFYGFEGVVQHYAAKHTNDLSLGSVVVHWRAEWPETPPFHPDPVTARQAPFSQHGAAPYPHSTTPNTGYTPYQPGVISAPQLGPSYPGNHGPPLYPDPYGGQHAMLNYLPAGAPPVAYGGHYAPPPPYSSQAVTFPAYQTGPGDYAAPAQPFPHSSMPPGATTQPGAAPPGPYMYNYNSYQSNVLGAYPGHAGNALRDPYKQQLDDMARSARELWNATSNIKDLPGSLRVFMTIFHVAKKFMQRFSIPLSLGMFIDGLSNNKEMRPVRNVNGLVCRACALSLGNAPIVESDRKSFSVPQLVNHFQSKHPDPVLNWTTDMIFLPDPATLGNLRNGLTPGTYKFQLVGEAAPWALENGPLHHPDQLGGTHADDHLPDGGLGPSMDRHDRFYDRVSNDVPQKEPGTEAHGASCQLARMIAHDPYIRETHTPVTRPQEVHLSRASPNGAQGYVGGTFEFDTRHGHEMQARTRPDLRPASSVYAREATAAIVERPRDERFGADSPNFHHRDDCYVRYSTSSGSRGPGMSHQSKTRDVVLEEGELPPASIPERSRLRSLAADEALLGGSRDRIPHNRSIYTEEDSKQAEEAERRNEEQIHAMWAADRVDTAHLQPHRTTSMEYRTEQLRSPGPRRHAVARPYEGLPQGRHPGGLTAALESHLDRERELTTHTLPHQYQTESAAYVTGRLEPRRGDHLPSLERHVPRQNGQGIEMRTRSRSPIYARYETMTGSRTGGYRERSPIVRYFDPPSHHRPASTAGTSDLQYDAHHRQDTYRVREDELGPRPPPLTQYVEEYEEIRLRDSQGEYVIRRPICREVEAAHIPYDEDVRTRRDNGHRIRYEQLEMPGSATNPAYQSRTQRRRYEPPQDADYEEYDPRFPAPMTGMSRQARY